MPRDRIELATRAWARLKPRIMARQGYRCAMCRKRLVPAFTDLDHVVPVEDGGAVWNPTNLQALHRGCHSQKTAQENRRRQSPPALVAGQDEWDDLLEEPITPEVVNL